MMGNDFCDKNPDFNLRKKKLKLLEKPPQPELEKLNYLSKKKNSFVKSIIILLNTCNFFK
jgi:hypothetical protein